MEKIHKDHHKNFAMLYAKNCAEIGVIANHAFLELLTEEDGDENNKNDKILNLNNTNLNDKDIMCIAECLRDVKKIKSLNISGNQLTSVGGRHIARALSHNDLIKNLNCADNDLSDSGVIAIISAISANTDNQIQTIDFSKNNISAPAVTYIMQLFKDHPNSTFLHEIILDNNNLTTESCTAISGGLLFAYSLKKLSLKNNNLNDESVNVLFDGIVKVAEVSTRVKGLEELYLDSNNISDDGLEHLISFNNKNGSGVFNGEIVLLNLKTLSLRGNKLTDDGMNELSKCHIGSESLLSRLEKLDCGENNKLTHQTVIYFAKILPLTTSLKYLDLSNIKLNKDSMQKISEGLQSNPPLRELIIADGITSIAAKELHCLKDALASNTRLEHVNWGTFDKNMTKDDISLANEYMNDIEQTLKLNRRMQNHNASTQKKKLKESGSNHDDGNDDQNQFLDVKRNLSMRNSPSSINTPIMKSKKSPMSNLKKQQQVFEGENKNEIKSNEVVNNNEINGNNNVVLGEASQQLLTNNNNNNNNNNDQLVVSDSHEEIDELRSTLKELHEEFRKFQMKQSINDDNNNNNDDDDDDGDNDNNNMMKQQILEYVGEQLREDMSEELVDTVKKENLDEVIESINQELEKEAFVRNNVVSKLELRLEKLENESKKAAIEREQSGVIIRALAKKVDESINILQETVAMIAAKNMNQESQISQETVDNIKGEWKDELATYEEQQRSERTVIEEHLARVSHRLIILEETVITEQESSLKALEAILTAAKNRKQRNDMVENEGDQSLV